MTVQVITPTGDRPEAFGLCARYLERQTYSGGIVWHVVDDGAQPTVTWRDHPGIDMRIYRLPPRKGNTLPRNMLELCDKLDPALPVICWEDDDWYSPDHIDTALDFLERGDAAGCARVRYYNVRQRCWLVMPSRGSALCNTALNGSSIHALRRAAAVCESQGRICVDREFWRLVEKPVIHEVDTVVGMKGLPGRTGLGMGHRPNGGWHQDRKLEKLRQWIGEDVNAYF